jgi:hypothetical protein
MLICIIENMNPNYNRIPCFVEKIKTTIKINGISKQNMGFSTTKYLQIFPLSKKLCLIIPLFPKSFFFGQS